MSAANQRARSQAAAAALAKRGIYHGKRQSVARPNSGGMRSDGEFTFNLTDAGSAAYRRRKAGGRS